MQTDSEYESDVSSITDSSTTDRNQPSCEHLVKRVDSLTQENRVLQIELQTYRLRLKASQQEIKQLKQFVDDRFFISFSRKRFFFYSF
jgi:coiled-coil domain-containing protein 6